MAEYRLEAQIISRSSGKSAVAAAAYRAGDRLEDERTGLHHDYSRKGGVIHSEILAPANTPEWMHDRAKLWNAVEAIEKRKNSQLSREIMLSLPHELTPEQRKKLVQNFIQEQFVERGMVADINIHKPNPKGDERNHHAHVMLTMRELTGDGFHSKKSTPTARGWNADELLQTWRLEWELHQNKMLERHGHPDRVDHRSYEAQGIDREPEIHRGVAANDRLVKGKTSRIEDENVKIRRRNSKRALLHARAAQLAAAMEEEKKTVARQWAEKRKVELGAQKQVDDKNLAKQHHAQKEELAAKQAEKYNIKTLSAEVKAIDKRLSATGFTKTLRNLFGATTRDVQTRSELTKAITKSEKNIEKEQHALTVKQGEEKMKLSRDQQKRQSQMQEQTKKRASAEFSQEFDKSRNQHKHDEHVKDQKETKQWEQPKPEPKPPEEALNIAQQWREKMGQKAPANDVKTTAEKEWKAATSNKQKTPEPEKKPSFQQSATKEQPTAKASPKDAWRSKKAEKKPEIPPRKPEPPKPNR